MASVLCNDCGAIGDDPTFIDCGAIGDDPTF